MRLWFAKGYIRSAHGLGIAVLILIVGGVAGVMAFELSMLLGGIALFGTAMVASVVTGVYTEPTFLSWVTSENWWSYSVLGILAAATVVVSIWGIRRISATCIRLYRQSQEVVAVSKAS